MHDGGRPTTQRSLDLLSSDELNLVAVARGVVPPDVCHHCPCRALSIGAERSALDFLVGKRWYVAAGADGEVQPARDYQAGE